MRNYNITKKKQKTKKKKKNFFLIKNPYKKKN